MVGDPQVVSAIIVPLDKYLAMFVIIVVHGLYSYKYTSYNKEEEKQTTFLVSNSTLP